MNFNQLPQSGFIRLEQIIGNEKKNIPPIIPVSKATIYKWISEGKFPPPDKRFGERISFWDVNKIRSLID